MGRQAKGRLARAGLLLPTFLLAALIALLACPGCGVNPPSYESTEETGAQETPSDLPPVSPPEEDVVEEGASADDAAQEGITPPHVEPVMDPDAGSDATDQAEEEGPMHYALTGRDSGTSRRMVGDIKLYCIFVEDSESHWTDEEIQEMYDGLWRDTAYLEEQAASYGVYLSFSSAWSTATVPPDQEDRWFDYLLETMYASPEHDYAAVQSRYEQDAGVDDMPFLFYFNKDGRCYCYMSRQGSSQPEYAVYYPSTMSSDRSIAHELYHLYGACDLYFPEAFAEAARRYLPNSSMLAESREPDELTAYLIGWTDTPGPNAAAFLEETSWVTQEDVDAGRV